ncbi:putative N-acetyltransferase HLS1-like [Senna tora]|uniref:Putative N-acetyltransferase HLS1-like n=1 Tax=Senna tora TaxID=362788 RepID=A0A834WCK6_9FABA|nr:putative N-acetyltransferase HLS1-like [Senna tora]
MDKELIGVIQGSIKVVSVQNHDLVKVGYVLGLRVASNHRRKGIGSSLVRRLEEWFRSNEVDYAYMATEKANHASVSLFMDKFGYTKFRTPAILVNPVNHHCFRISSSIEITRLKVEEAESLYRRFMGCSDFFPDDIDRILRNKLSLGTWVAYYKGDSSWGDFGNGEVPSNWAMLSVWNSGEIFKLRLGKATLSCLLYTKSWSLIDRVFPCLKLPTLPDFLNPFGFYFMYGVCHEGPFSGRLVRGLCEFVHNMAAKCEDRENIKIVVTEIGGRDELKHHIPHWKLLSSLDDLWCIKALKNEGANRFSEFTKTPPSTPLFVDPREV